MRRLQPVLKMLEDSKWHDYEEIRRKVRISDDDLGSALNFFSEVDVAEYDRMRNKVRIRPFGLEILKLPDEEWNIEQ